MVWTFTVGDEEPVTLGIGGFWPVAETRCKGRRTFATVLGLMERYPDVTFNRSSARHYARIEVDAQG